MSTCHVFARPDHDEPDSRLCTDDDGGELTVFHSASTRTEGGAMFCEACGTYVDDIEPADSIVLPLPDGRWQALGRAQ